MEEARAALRAYIDARCVTEDPGILLGLADKMADALAAVPAVTAG